MNRFYKKSFTFRATHYEQWQGGFCTANGPISTFITAEVNNQTISFTLEGTDYLEIYEYVEMELPASCMLHDRIQYMKGSCQWDPNEPMICHLFIRDNHIHCIRFAMTSPDRIIEFYGREESIGEVRKPKTKKIVHSAEDIINKITAFCQDDPYSAIMEKAAQMIDTHYRMETEMDYMAFIEIIKLYHASNRLLDAAEKDNSFYLKKGQLLAHLAMCQKGIGNGEYAYKLAKRAVSMFREWQKTSVIQVSSCDIFGENKATDIIEAFEDRYPGKANTLCFDNIDEYELNLDYYDEIIDSLREKEELHQAFPISEIEKLLGILKSEYEELQQRIAIDLLEKMKVRQVGLCIGRLNAALVYFMVHQGAEVDPGYCMLSYLQAFIDEPHETITFLKTDHLFKEIVSALQHEVSFDIESLIDNLAEIVND